MDLIRIYQCFCDLNRLRILHLLSGGPLCVCHLQSILELPQAKVSQQLAYLRKHGMVESTRHGNWMIYRLPSKPSRELEKNLKCLQDCIVSEPVFREDLAALTRIKADPEWTQSPLSETCCP